MPRPDLHPEDVEDLGRAIAEARQSKGWTQERLAKFCDVTRQTIYFLEGGRRTPSLALLTLICDALGVTPDSLLDY